MQMMTDDTIVALENYCSFGDDRVYLLIATARQKDNPGITSGSEVVVREVVKDRKGLRRKHDELRCVAEQYRDDSGNRLRFRLYITVNARNTVKAYFNFRERMDRWVKDRFMGDEFASRKFKQVDDYWMSELQKAEARDEALFLFDLDDPDEEVFRELRSTLDEYTSVITRRETPNGYHLVTEPFTYSEMKTPVDYELKTDGLLFLVSFGDEEAETTE